MLVVTEVVFIALEKVTEIFSVIETPFWLSAGETEETVGAVQSVPGPGTSRGISKVKLLVCVPISKDCDFPQ